MTGNTQKRLFKIAGLAVAVLLLCGIYSAFAQEQKRSPLSEYQYSKYDYPRYEKTIKEQTDLNIRAEYWIFFIKERGISKLIFPVITDYLKCIQPMIEKEPEKAAAKIEEIIAMLPTDETIKAAEIPADADYGVDKYKKEQLIPSQDALNNALFSTYIQSKNYPKAAEILEKFYAKSSDKDLLPKLAGVYKQFNKDKYMEYTQKIVAELPIEQSFGAALELTESALQKQDMKTATELLNKILAAFGEKTPPNVQESAWNSTKAWAYNILAAEIYKTKDYPKAAESFEKAVKYNPKLADAYYLLGRCKWQTKEIDSAISNIAKYIVLGGTSYGARPQQDLETLYKPTHNGTLDGLDQVLAKAKADLGIQ